MRRGTKQAAYGSACREEQDLSRLVLEVSIRKERW